MELVRLVFLLGETDDDAPEVQARIEMEAQTHRDIVQVNSFIIFITDFFNSSNIHHAGISESCVYIFTGVMLSRNFWRFFILMYMFVSK